MTEHTKGLLFAATTAICWGFLAIVLKMALNSLDALSIVWVRFTIAFILLGGYYLITNPKSFRIFKEFRLYPLLSAIFLSFNYLGYMKGVEYTTPSNAQILIQLGPILLALCGFIFFKEKFGRSQGIGLVVSLTGFSFFYSDQLNQMLHSGLYNAGAMWVILAAISWTIYAVFQKLASKNYTPSEINLMIYSVGSLSFVSQADFAVFPDIGFSGWAVLIFLGLNTLIAYGCMGEALKLAPANQISIIITLNPLITLFMMSLIAKFEVQWIQYESITYKGYIGAILVVLGAMMIVGIKKKK